MVEILANIKLRVQLHGSLFLLPDPLLAAFDNTYVAVLNV